MGDDLDFDFVDHIPQQKLATQGASAREKRIVCRFWLSGVCSKDEKCNFLHVMDLDRMPECPFGSKCKKKNCLFKHTPEEEKEECVNFRLGFCSHGPVCKFRHVVKTNAELPPISELWTVNYIAEQKARQRLQENSSQFRVVPCPIFERDGWCSFFDQCTYAHGPHQIRKFIPNAGWKKQRDEVRYTSGAKDAGGARGRPSDFDAPAAKRGRHAGSAPPQHDIMSRILSDYDANAAAMNLPDSMGPSRYFVVKAVSTETLALSLKRAEWVSPVRFSGLIESILRVGQQAFIFFSVVNSQGFEGVARVRAPPVPLEDGGRVLIPIEWLRTCFLPFTYTAGIVNSLNNSAINNNNASNAMPVSRSRDWQELSTPAGKAVMLMVFRSEEVPVDTSSIPADGTFEVLDSDSPEGKALLDSEEFGDALPPTSHFAPEPAPAHGAGRPGPGPPRESAADVSARAASFPPMLQLLSMPVPAPADASIGELLAGKRPADIDPAVPPEILAADAYVQNRPGYVFGCTAQTAGLCLQSGVFAAPEDHAMKMRALKSGTPCLLINVSTKQVFGLFVARLPAKQDLVPPGTFPPLLVRGVNGQPERHLEQSWQSQMLCVCEVPPMPLDYAQTLLPPGMSSGPFRTGPIPPEGIHAVAARMFARLPTSTLYQVTGLLRHMALVGMPPDGLL